MRPGQQRYILTLLTRGEGSNALHAVSELTHRFGMNIDTVRRLTDRGASRGDEGSRLCVEMRMRGADDRFDALEAELLKVAEAP